MADETLPRLLMRNAERLGEKVALREKEFGIWQTVTWRKFAEHVRAFAMGLSALGVQRHDTVAIIGDNRPEWLYAELGAQAIGAISVGIYQELGPRGGQVYPAGHRGAGGRRRGSGAGR